MTADGPSAQPTSAGRRWLVEALVVFAILSVVGSCVALPLLTHENFGKPQGRAIPVEPPDEANRVSHPQGFSMVFPTNWDVHVRESPRVEAVPRTVSYRIRSPAVLRLTSHGAARPEIGPEFRPTTLGGEAAFESMERRADTFDDEGHFRYTLLFERGGSWFELLYLLGRDAESLPPMMVRYFETFRVGPSP